MLLAVFTATRLGPDELAAFQVTMTVFATVAFALDALAIAAQALVGKGLGAADLSGVRAVLVRCIQWGVMAGVVLGGLSENLSMVLGFDRLLLAAVAFYAISAVLGRRSTASVVAPA